MSSPQNLVHEVSTSTGTGDLTTSPVLGKQSFSDAFSTGGTDVFTYFISNKDADPTEWEVGTGHMSDVSTLVRDTVLNSSNSDSAVDFSTGSKHITNALPAEFYPTGDIVGTTDIQTLTNKTITDYFATAATRTALAAITDTTNKPTVWLREGNRNGPFTWNSADLSAQVTIDTQQGIYVPPASDTTGASGCWVRDYQSEINAGWFGPDPADAKDGLQAAFDFAQALIDNDGPYPRVANSVFIPPGEWNIASGDTIRVTKGLLVRGAGRSVTWIVHGGGSVACFDTNTGTTNNVEIEFRDLSIYGAGSTTTAGINFNDAIRNAGLTNVDISNCNDNVILDDCWTFRLERCNIRDAARYNISWGNATAAYINNSRIDGAGTYNILISASTTTQYTVQLVFQNTAVQFAEEAGIALRDVDMAHITGCYFEGNNAGGGGNADIRIYNSGGNTHGTLFTVSNCYATSTGAGAADSIFVDITRGDLNVSSCFTYNGSSNYTKGINAASTVGRVVIVGSNINATTRISKTSSTEVIEIANPNKHISVGGAYNGSHLLIGSGELWRDSSGDLRYKDGTPSSATDGVSLNGRLKAFARTPINDDAAASFVIGTGAYSSPIFFSCNATTNPAGVVIARAAASANGVAKVSVVGATSNVYSTALTGTTGADASLNLGADTSGNFYIENRTGGAITVAVWVFVPEV